MPTDSVLVYDVGVVRPQKTKTCPKRPLVLQGFTVIRRHLSICPIILWTVGAPHDVTTNLRHSSLSSAFLTVSLSPKPVHSQMLSSHRFLCLPLPLPPCTVPWRNVLAGHCARWEKKGQYGYSGSERFQQDGILP